MILLDAHGTSPGIYLMLGRGPGPFYGATIYRSPDQTQWNAIATVATPAVMGTVESVLPVPSTCWLPERGPPVRVRLANPDDSLVTATEIGLKAGANLALFGRELVQFRVASLQSDGSWLLFDRRRGRKGTDWAVGTHAIGERFCMITTVAAAPAPGIVWVNSALSELGVTRYYQAVPNLGTLAPTGQAVHHSGETMRPWAVVHVQARRDRATGDITLSWRARSRYTPASAALVPPDSDVDEYEVVVLDGPGGALLRTLAVEGATEVVYSAADQAVDFPDGTPDPLHVAVYRWSAAVGRGVGKAAAV